MDLPVYAPADVSELVMERLQEWLTYDSVALQDSSALFQGFCRQLRYWGVPVARLTYGVQTLHPLSPVFLYVWSADRDTVDVLTAPWGHETTPVYQQSPFRVIYEGGSALRRRLEGGDVLLDFPVLVDFQKQGGTDYFALPVPFSNGDTNAITVLTKQPGGFTDEQLNIIRSAVQMLTPALEVRHVRAMARTLVDTYIGRHSGERVLSGSIHRGSGEAIHAVVWFCDLRGFTVLSEALPHEELIDVLNNYFGIMCKAVVKEGGEVLKFMGDAMLAIFPLDENCCMATVCGQAMKASAKAREDMAALNEKRLQNDQVPLAFGIALHVGDVLYGNIGGEDRLDFTVIGPAVNLTSRLEGVCANLNKRMVVSARFADTIGGGLPSLGRHQLKGITEPQEVFTCPMELRE